MVKEKANLKPVSYAKELNLIVYWTTLLVLIIANLLMSMVIIPFLLLASGLNFYIILAVLGIFFGYVFALLISNIENLDAHHHLIAAFFIPIFAIINLIIISTSLEGITSLLGIASQKEPLTVSLVYAVFFLLPYVISMARKRL